MKLAKLVWMSVAVSLCGLTSHAGQSVFDNVVVENGYDSASGSFANIPAGAWVCTEASAVAQGSSAYASAYGGGVNLSTYVSYPNGWSDLAQTLYSSSVSYSIGVSGSGYAFVEISWGYGK